MDIEARIQSYFGELERDAQHRYRSWEHCYRFFQQATPAGLAKRRHEAALQLGFYLASWGMYRGGSFLLQRDYTVHLGAVDCLCDPQWSPLWRGEFGADNGDYEKVDQVVELRRRLGAAYSDFGNPSDTLATKIMLGTVACSPACDRYFVGGFKSKGYQFSAFNRQFLGRIVQFCRLNESALRRAQAVVEKSVGMRYPLIKLVDMYFFQLGIDAGVTASSHRVPD